MPNDIANNMADTIHQLEEDRIMLSTQLTDLQFAYNNQMLELKEAKRLLKVMYEDIKRYAGGMCRVCTECTADFECKCEDFCATNKRSKWKYKYEPEILALIGEEGGNNA